MVSYGLCRAAPRHSGLEVLVKLRGYNIEPMEGRFLLRNPGPDEDLAIEATAKCE